MEEALLKRGADAGTSPETRARVVEDSHLAPEIRLLDPKITSLLSSRLTFDAVYRTYESYLLEG